MKLSATQLTCERDDRILFSNLNFTLKSGQMLQVLGENGSGKTSLLKIMTGLSEPHEGNIFWNDHNIKNCRSDYVNQFHYLGHKNGITLGLTVLENLRWFTKLNDTTLPSNMVELLERAHLSPYRDTMAQYLSAGQLRRLAILKLLISSRRLWILDEPLTSLDADGIAWAKGLFIQHIKSGGLMILTCHHGLENFPVTIHPLILNT